MSEPQEPRRFPQAPPGEPLPRIWKAEPDPAPEAEVPKKKKKKGGKTDDEAEDQPQPGKKKKSAKKSAAAKGKDGATKGVLIEETPTLDTYQARQAVRIITGAVILGVLFLSFFIIYRVFSRSGTPEPLVDQETITLNAPGNSPNYEQEARNMFERAREVARNGNTPLAVSLLQKVNKSYPKSRTAIEARAALDRPGQNLPLFLDRPTVVATPGAPAAAPPKPAPMPAPVPVVIATKPNAPQAGDGEATLIAPPNSAEPVPSASAATSPPVAEATPSKPLPSGFRLRPGSKVHPSGWPLEIVGDRDGAPMVLVPGGTFTMGRDDGESAEAPAHKVTLGSYYIDRHEVTVRQFDLFTKEAGPRRDRDRALAKDHDKPKDDASDDAPVVMVSARDAKDYAGWAHKTLPTEAQWEIAARSTDARLFPWGNDPDAAKPRKSREIEPIRSFPLDTSPYGVYDLAGNAWEWTKDWYDPHYFQKFKNAVADNPVGPDKPKSEQLTVKGGAKNWVVTKREGLKWSMRLPYLGFRCVLSVENKDHPASGGAIAAPGGGIPF